MSAIPNLDTLVNSLTGGGSGPPQTIFFFKDPYVSSSGIVAANNSAGHWASLWLYNGNPAGSSQYPPTTARNPTNLTTGSLMTYTNAVVNQNWMLSCTAGCSTPGTLMIYDRLADISGLSATTLTPQVVSQSLARYSGSTTCIGNQIWIEVYSSIGTTAENITCTYINQNGVTKTTVTESFGGVNYFESQSFWPLPLASGDSGVQAVNSVQLGTSTGTAGNFGITIVRPLTLIPINYAGQRDLVADICSPMFVEANACLAFAYALNTVSGSIQLTGNMQIIEV